MKDVAGNTKRTTIYDIAELAETSAGAVSAVLTGKWKKRRISARLAEKIEQIAQEQGYAPNIQASLLRREQSHLVGMIVPKYDNRYFGSIVEHFETMARARGLFPIITCTQRDPALEMDAAREMISHQVRWIVSTGATNPDRITELCATSGVQTLNLDLPGSLAPSVISDNYAGARELTLRVLEKHMQRYGTLLPLTFVGGRGTDNNTIERVRGFRDAHAQMGIELSLTQILTCGYAPERAERALAELSASGAPPPLGMFVNSTISLEGVLRWLRNQPQSADYDPVIGCFDWDPLVMLLNRDILMVRQDVPTMLREVFKIIESDEVVQSAIVVPTILVSS